MKDDIVWRCGFLTVVGSAFVFDRGEWDVAIFLLIVGLLTAAYPWFCRVRSQAQEKGDG